MLMMDGVDYCQMWSKLEEVRLALLSGEMAVEARFGSDTTIFQQVDLDRLEKRIAEVGKLCTIQRGEPFEEKPAFQIVNFRNKRGW